MEQNKQLLDKDGNIITKERIEEVMKEVFKDQEPWIKNNKWVEDGVQYSSWEFGGSGRATVYTGDAGAALIQEAMREEIMKNLAENHDTKTEPTEESK